MMLRVLTLAATLCSAAAALGWVKGGDMCIGIDTDCNNVASCTTTVFGPCATDAGASKYLKSQFVGMAFVKEDTYLANSADMKVIEPDSAGDQNDQNGYRDFKGDETAGNDATYAYTMVGGRFGDMATAGGYVGIASYLNTGSVDISVNKMAVRVGNHNNKVRRDGSVDSGNEGLGSLGAPMGPFDICISEFTDSETDKCGANRVISPGEYKFSVFGWTSGTNYPPPKSNNGFPAYTHIGVRMKLEAVNFDVADLKINGDKTLSDIASTDVTKIELVHASGKTLKIEFPLKYNVGSVVAGAGPGAPAATHTIKIKVSDASTDASTTTGPDVQAIYLDYLFDASAAGGIDTADKYFIYDPSVSDGAPPPAACSDTVTCAGDKVIDATLKCAADPCVDGATDQGTCCKDAPTGDDDDDDAPTGAACSDTVTCAGDKVIDATLKCAADPCVDGATDQGTCCVAHQNAPAATIKICCEDSVTKDWKTAGVGNSCAAAVSVTHPESAWKAETNTACTGSTTPATFTVACKTALKKNEFGNCGEDAQGSNLSVGTAVAPVAFASIAAGLSAMLFA